MKRYFVLSFITLFLSKIAFSFYGSFDVFSEPKYVPNNFCDRGTHLELAYKSPGLRTATLNEFVRGQCEILVKPNMRDYRVKSVKYNNGLVVHSGSRETSGGRYNVEIVDARQSNYKALVPALIIVREHGPEEASVLYSYP